MTNRRFSSCLTTLLAVFLIAPNAVHSQARKAVPKTIPESGGTLDLTLSKPESVGFSSERLERLHALIQRLVSRSSFRAL